MSSGPEREPTLPRLRSSFGFPVIRAMALVTVEIGPKRSGDGGTVLLLGYASADSAVHGRAGDGLRSPPFYRPPAGWADPNHALAHAGVFREIQEIIFWVGGGCAYQVCVEGRWGWSCAPR